MVDEVGLEPTNPKELIYSQPALPNLRTHPYKFNLYLLNSRALLVLRFDILRADSYCFR